jgi:3-methyladenine DNA glycosylase AlkD
VKYGEYHAEVVAALRLVGDRRYGEAIRADRKSSLQYLGVPTPDMRRAVKRGFSFYALDEAAILDTWDSLWNESPYGDVLFAGIDYYRHTWPRRPSPVLWPVVQKWVGRVDNWAHADALAGLYSFILERYPSDVWPQIEAWNRGSEEWPRRISLVSLIHYSGKNAVFLPAEQVLPLITNCLDDRQYYVQTAVGWVLREMGGAYSEAVRAYLEQDAGRISAVAFTRAIERLGTEEKARLRAIRTART